MPVLWLPCCRLLLLLCGSGAAEQCGEDGSRKCTGSGRGQDKSGVVTNGSSNRFVLVPRPLVGWWLFLFKREGNVIVLVFLPPGPLEWGWEESFYPGQQRGLMQRFSVPGSCALARGQTALS